MSMDIDHDDHLDPTSEITLDTVKKRAVKGVAVLTGRNFLLKFASFIAFGFIGAYLSEEQFGVFILVSAVVNFLAYFSDVGLAAALIQKKEKVTNEDLKTTFLVQESLVVLLVAGLFLASPYLQEFYNLSDEGKLLMYALGISFFLSSLKTIPSILLERELDFAKFVLPEILETLTYNSAVVFFAWQELGIRSFTYAVLLRGIVGVIAIYYLKPWRPGLAFSKESLKKLLSFGFPYQINTFLAVLKDDGMTMILGGIIGTQGIGILGWAQKWAQYPLRLFMDQVLKVTFPAFSRMQDDTEHLRRSLTRSIFFVCFLVFPSVIGMYLLAPLIIEIVPRYEKWRPALFPLGLLSINVLFAASTTQLTNLFNSIGKIKLTFKLMILWTSLTWLTVPFLARNYGVNGAALGYAIVGCSSIVAIIIGYKIIQFSILDSILKPLASTLIMGTVLLIMRGLSEPSLFWIGSLILVGGLVYLISTYFLVGKWIVTDAKRGISAVYRK